MAKARPIPGLGEDDAYALAAARVVEIRARELTEHSVGVLDTTDIERVHDMRVATRRLRAALEVFEPCFPRKPFRAALKEVKAVADALGERRDRDVHIAALTEYASAADPADRPGVDSLISRFCEEQQEANRELEPFVHQQRLSRLVARLDQLASAAKERVDK